MNILILSCNTGQGHNSVAHAIAETLDARGHSWELEDALGFISHTVSKVISRGHSFIYCHCPELFQAGYGAAERHPNTLSDKSVTYKFFALGARDLYDYCMAHDFDVIICTHVFASMMLTEIRNNWPLSAKCYFVATDYTSYPGVQDTRMDTYFIPDDRLADAYAGKATITSGIPVYQQFFNTMDRKAAKSALGLNPDSQHILVMCGSMGCGPMEDIVEYLNRGMETGCSLSVICGTNRNLQRKLSEKYRENPHVHIHGYVQNVPEFMSSADVYVTKPGGISTTEAMAHGLPMVLVDAVAGCEDYNMHYFEELGSAVSAKAPKDIGQLCLDLVQDAPRRAAMSQAMLTARKNGAQIICDYLEQH